MRRCQGCGAPIRDPVAWFHCRGCDPYGWRDLEEWGKRIEEAATWYTQRREA